MAPKIKLLNTRQYLDMRHEAFKTDGATPETQIGKAVFGQANYNWQDEYRLNLVTRRDGSSRFGPANKFANFGSVGGPWTISKGPLTQKLFPLLSFGKISASYGTAGILLVYRKLHSSSTKFS